MKCGYQNSELIVSPSSGEFFRYLRMSKSPAAVAEIEGFIEGKPVDRVLWKATNLSGSPRGNDVKLCWKYDGKLTGIGKKAYLSVTVPAVCQEGTVFAAMMIDGKIIGAADRAPSFPYNNWEHFGRPEKDFTFYLPVNEKLEGKPFQVILLSTDSKLQELKPEVWLTNLDIYEKVELVME